jgi:hypothetical protein
MGVARAALVRMVRPGFPRPQPMGHVPGRQGERGIGDNAARSLTSRSEWLRVQVWLTRSNRDGWSSPLDENDFLFL